MCILLVSSACTLAKNLNTAPLSFVLASHSFCKTIMWKLYGETFQRHFRANFTTLL